jgi:hypothetical protein
MCGSRVCAVAERALKKARLCCKSPAGQYVATRVETFETTLKRLRAVWKKNCRNSSTVMHRLSAHRPQPEHKVWSYLRSPTTLPIRHLFGLNTKKLPPMDA